ncbi:hypothetical protein Tdes44962_MAKER09434 [Teratosphaeria destructans]|uniref:Uncharacterized protein n=1 Tax=Teratosphaeria destructans TaxID=418781 RepID=A0A9W7W3A2_9PEZI|nr:hypothetical protein Tdes44962_MAKER09434 [Teratosphaeria destructans]
MPPKQSPLTAADASGSHKPIRGPLHPLTTQQKIARAQLDALKAAKNQPREAPELSQKPVKARSFAPPGEQEWLDRALLRKQKKTKVSSKGKPMTTQEKIRAVRRKEGARRGRDVVGREREFARPDLGGHGVEDDEAGDVGSAGSEEGEGEGDDEIEKVVHKGFGNGEASAGGMVGCGLGFMKPLTARGPKMEQKKKQPRLMDVMKSYLPTTKSFSASGPVVSGDDDAEVDTAAEVIQTATATKKGKRSKITPRICLDMSAVTGSAPCFESGKETPKKPGVLIRRTRRSLVYIGQVRQAALAASLELRELDSKSYVKDILKRVEQRRGRPFPRNEVLRETVPKLLKLWEGGAIFSSPVLAEDGTEMPMKGHGFRLMDLPEELRQNIWKLVVVDTKTFVRPDSPTGREQPDTAMTCRQVRAEVLPVFYRENTFALDVAPCGPLRAKKGGETGIELSSIPAAKKWAAVIEEAGWFRFIRHWVFTHTPEPVKFSRTQLPVIPVTSSGFVPASLRSMVGEDNYFILSLSLARKQNRGWDINVEVHREASCIMPGLDPHATCYVKRSPGWLNEILIESLVETGAKVVPAKLVLELAEAVKGRVNELMDLRCRDRVPGAV